MKCQYKLKNLVVHQFYFKQKDLKSDFDKMYVNTRITGEIEWGFDIFCNKYLLRG